MRQGQPGDKLGVIREGWRTAGGKKVAGVLEGLRVLDFGRYIAGPFCAALLGDLGAEVIRIERIGGGEDRGMIPVGAGPDGGGAMFLAINHHTARAAL
jgi:crotonobetainyl-CoA:carnitine CoA-transferase CaiB-like acyl-CoA transferase